MSQPPVYNPQHSFVADSATLANFPGQALDVEFQSVKATTDAIEDNLALIQRDDGALANSSVGYDQLSGTLQTAGLSPATGWVTGHAYVLNASVITDGSLYRALVAHTSGVFATDLAAGKWLLIGSLTSAAGLVIATPPNTLTQSLLANGSLPATGTSSTTFNFAEVNGTNPGYTVTAASIDGFGGFPSTNAFRATYSASGGSPINSAVYGAARQTAPTVNLTGVIGSAYSNIAAPSDALWGMIGFTSVNASGNVGAAIAIAGESIAGTGAVMGSRVGVAAVSETNIQGTNLDAAFAVATGSAPGVAPYSATGPWKYGFVLSRILYGNQGPPLSTDGKVMYADTAFTTTDFADMSAVTFTGKLFNFTNYAMDANGYTSLGSSTVPTGDIRLRILGAGRGVIENFVATNVTTGVNGFQISDSAGTNQAFLGVAEAANTGSRFGVTLGGYAEFVSYGANNGMLLGTVASKPVILGANNVEIIRLASGGGVTVPSTVTGGDKGAGTLNASGLYDSGNRVLTSASLGTGVATFLATPNSANLRGALTDETGTGAAVFATSPTITTPNTIGTSTNDNAAAGSVGEYIQTASSANNANATVTMTIAAPCVVTWTAHGFAVGAVTTAVKFTTTGALPTGITSGTTYYLKAIDANTFSIATTADNALAGTFITTTGTQSGTHTADIRVTMVTGVPQNVAAFSLGAGDWEVVGQMLKGAGTTTTVTYLAGNTATSSAGVDRTFGRRLSFQYGGLVLGSTEFTVFDFAPTRFSLSGTTTIYLVADDSFGTSTLSCSGWLRARRAR